MQTSPLFLGLIVAGVILVLGVVIVNWLQMRRARHPTREASPRSDPPSVALKRAGGRVEPGLREGRSASAADADAVVGSIAINEEPEAIDVLSPGDALAVPSLGLPQALTGRAAQAALAPDPDIESVVMVRPPQAVPTSALATALDIRLAKPVRWLGRRGPGLPWLPLEPGGSGPWTDVAACLLLANRAGAASRSDIDAFLALVSHASRALPAVPTLPDGAAEASRADTLDRICADLDVQVGLTILKAESGLVTGTRLRGVAEAAGFRLTASGQFEFVQEETGAVLYTLQSLKGDPFTVESLRTTSLPGVVLILDVPRVQDPVRVFDQMKLLAKRITKTLDAVLVDDNRRPLNDPALAAIREQVQATADALRATNIDPGSPRAMRLFG